MRQMVKEAITVALFIDEIQEDGYNIPFNKVKLAQKATQALLKKMKEEGYERYKDRYGETYYNRIKRHLEEDPEKARSYDIYLTYIQMQVHSFLRGLNYDVGYGGYSRNTKYVSYYRQTLKSLMGIV